jgi:hypothetical protein
MSYRSAERPPKPASTWAAWWRRKMALARLRWPVLRAAFGPKDTYYAARRGYRIAYRNTFGGLRTTTRPPRTAAAHPTSLPDHLRALASALALPRPFATPALTHHRTYQKSQPPCI